MFPYAGNLAIFLALIARLDGPDPEFEKHETVKAHCGYWLPVNCQ